MGFGMSTGFNGGTHFAKTAADVRQELALTEGF